MVNDQMQSLLSFFIVAIAVLALQPHQTTTAAASKETTNFYDYDADEPCDGSFPMAPASSLLLLRQRSAAATTETRQKLKIVIPNDPTRRSYAPLCADGRRIDIRRLEECGGGHCYNPALDGCFHVTSRECTAPMEPPPAAEIPAAPVEVEVSESADAVETVHPVKLVLKDVPRGYRPPPEVRSMILRLVATVLEEDLADGLEIIDVEYAGRLPPVDRGVYAQDGNVRRRFEDVPMPLRVTVRGPANMSDVALSYIIAAIQNRVDNLSNQLRMYGESLDRNVFLSAKLSTDTFDFEDVLTAPTETPSNMLATTMPTRKPTEVSLEDGISIDAAATEVLDDTVKDTAKVPWWTWLIIVMVILLLCICVVCWCVRRRRQRDGKDKQEVNIWVQNRNAANPRRSKRKPPPQQRRPQPRKVHLRDEGERSSHPRHSAGPLPVRPSIKRHLSQTELEEEARLAREPLEPEEELSHVIMYRDANYLNNGSRKRPEDDESHFTEGLEPPEEGALVPYNPSHDQCSEDDRSYASEEPEGPNTKSMFVSDVCHNLDTSNTSRASERHEPDGHKVPKQLSIFASDAYHLKTDVSDDDDGHRKPRRVKRAPKKDAMFLCSWEELPEEVKVKTKSRTEREEAKSKSRSRTEREDRKSTRGSGAARENHSRSDNRKSRNHKKKHRSAPQKEAGRQ